jgi:uncharacterized protein
MTEELNDEVALQATRQWLEKAVIGLNLCPFAKAVYTRDQVRMVVSHATDTDALLQELAQELALLAAADPNKTDTTLLIHPRVLNDFLDYNDFLDAADAVVEQLELDGELQVASFHPDYQFDGTAPDAVENFTNRAPYPTLHILREASVDKAVQAFPEAENIYEKNIETLQALGREGWDKLWKV